MTVEDIRGKRVYVVVEHHEVLEAWAEIRRGLEKSPILISLDHHTDYLIAFLHQLYLSAGSDTDSLTPTRLRELASVECAKIKFQDAATVEQAIGRLRNDEHIDAAIRSGILDHSYSITYSHLSTPRKQIDHLSQYEQIKFAMDHDLNSGPYDPPPDRMFHVERECAIGCTAMPHTDTCRIEHSAQAIESVYLSDKLNKISEMSPTYGIPDILQVPFILDIDLDYFHSARSIHPQDTEVFYDLIRRAVAITIAVEPNYFLEERLPGEIITSNDVLAAVREHIRKAQEHLA